MAAKKVERREVLELLSQGIGASEVARKLNISRSRVNQIKAQPTLKIRIAKETITHGFIKVNGTKEMPHSDHDRIIQLYESGLTSQEIVKETSFSTLKVNAVLRSVNKNLNELYDLLAEGKTNARG